MFAKRFFYVSAGLLCLALAYHLGASNATAQQGGQIVAAVPLGGAGAGLVVLTTNGDTFYRLWGNNYTLGSALVPMGNFWSGATPVQRESWGAVKQRYR